ncbi:asparaginase [Variovorax sp. AFSI2.2]|uniref:asparaginase n=1 Tax=Variovorax sp. AFSI2.2 TaxID=3384160 RepID=UPI003EBF4C6C
MTEDMTLPICVLVATGGTIAMKIDPLRKVPVPALSGEDLLAAVPGISELARLEVNDFSNLPSDHMGPDNWALLSRTVDAALQRTDVAGVIVSHGTDTLEEAAWFLDLTLASEKPVVLAGAQRNASTPDFDGPRNLMNAVRVCLAPEAKGKGVMVVMNNQIHAARDVTKTHTSEVESFKSGDFGFLGSVDQDRVVFSRSPLRRQHVALRGKALPPVEIVPMYGGASGAMLNAAVVQGAGGIVVQALGLGNVNVPMFEAIESAIRQGIAVVVSTRVPNGRVAPVYGFVGGGSTLKAAGAVFADNLSPQKARILLMLALQENPDPHFLQTLFDR